MKVSNEFITSEDGQFHETITTMYCTKKELEAHQQQLEELGIPSIAYDSHDANFDKLLVTTLGGFWVKFEGEEK